MSKFPASKIVVYPSANSTLKSYKVNSEKNLTSLAANSSRNRVISGLGITISSNIVYISEGSCCISGYTISILSSTQVANLSGFTTDGKYWVYLSLSRNSSGDKNLIGMTEDGQTFNGVNFIIDQDTPPLADTLTIGYLTKSGSNWTYTALTRSKTYLRAQDIYVQGSVNGTQTDDTSPQNEGDPNMSYLNPSAPLDLYLANLIISDGQFN